MGRKPSDFTTAQSNYSTAREANDYRDAAQAVIDIVEAVANMANKGKFAAVFEKATKFTPLARQMVNMIPNVAPVANRVAAVVRDKAPDAVNEAGDSVVRAAKGAGDMVVQRGKAVGDAVRGAIDERAQQKARTEARRALLDGAGNKLSVEDFMKTWRMQSGLSVQDGEGIFAYYGCYAIVTYPSAVKKGNYHKFKGIYVGKSDDMFKSIHDDIIGKGNVDVYADVKYGQHVYVFLYPCAADKLESLEASLITALDADSSYNAEKTGWLEGND